MSTRIATFAEFWPFYVSQHRPRRHRLRRDLRLRRTGERLGRMRPRPLA